MTDPVDLLALARETQRKADAATEGPWTYQRSVLGLSENLQLASPALVKRTYYNEHQRRCHQFLVTCEAAKAPNDANAEFIAHARAAAPLLAAEVVRLHEATCGTCTHWDGHGKEARRHQCFANDGVSELLFVEEERLWTAPTFGCVLHKPR